MRTQVYSRWSWRKILQQFGLAITAIFLMLPLAMGPALATGLRDIPIVKAGSDTWVIDQGDVLSPLNKGSIERKLSKLAEQTGNEVRFVTLRRFDYGEDAETFVNGLFERWFPTAAAQANQTLVLLDSQTNSSGIRTGDQVKALMTDEVAQSIASETLLVPIREDNYNKGFLDATSRLSLVLSGQPDPGPPEVKVVEVESTFKSAKETDAQSATIIVVVLLIAATVIPMATYYWYQRG